MKDQATHIRIIRDENGTPVEAQYDYTYINFSERIFKEWAEANRIPVTGDWPTDKNVFAMEEVDYQWQYCYFGEWINCTEKEAITIYSGFDTRKSLHLKAKQEEQPKQVKYTESNPFFSEIEEPLRNPLMEELRSQITPEQKAEFDKELDRVYGGPKQEPKTVEISLDNFKEAVAIKYGYTCFAEVKNKYRTGTLHVGDLIAFVDEANRNYTDTIKQQYQREIIEKLNKAGEWRAVEIIKGN